MQTDCDNNVMQRDLDASDAAEMTIQRDRIYNTNETAALLGISKFALETWRSGDCLEGPPFVRMGPRNIRYRGADLLGFVEAMTVRPEAA